MGQTVIFSTATGGGHNQVAAVLAHELARAGHGVEIIDYLQVSSHFLDSVINGGYNRFLSQTGLPYGWLYNASQQDHLNNGLSNILRGLLTRNIVAMIEDKNPDLIISTHPLIVKTLGDLKRKRRIKAPVISVITDFKAHRFYCHPDIDAYVVPSRHTGDTLCVQGVNPARIHVNGIPIRREFTIRTIRQRGERFTALVMAGTYGSNAMYNLLETMVMTDERLNIIAVCGTNDKLRERLEQNLHCLPENIRLEVHGYYGDIDRLMDRAHVLISKPGGITVSEAINKALPLVIPFWISGQEEENRRYLLESGLALGLDDYRDINRLLSALIAEPRRLELIERQMRLLARSYSIDQTIQLAERLICANASSHVPVSL